jgi:hypothetical protein
MKQNFRIKLDGDSRAVSFRNIEVTSSSNGIVVTPKGVKTMIRQYLKSIEKKIYEYPISFKYYKKSNGLDIKINGITGDEIRSLLPKFDQFTEGNAFRDVSTNYLISFDLRSLALLNGTPNARPTTTPAPTPAPQPSSELPKATKIYIRNHEGTGEFDNTTFTSWSDLQNALEKIYDNWSKNPDGYDKVQLEFEWQDGETLKCRVDVGDENSGNYNPTNEFIGDYLKKIYGKYGSVVSWQDDEETESPQQQPDEQPEQTNKITLKSIEVFSKGKFVKRFKNWSDADNYFESVWKKMKRNTTKVFNVYAEWENDILTNAQVVLNSEEYYPDGNDSYYDPFLYDYLYNSLSNNWWMQTRDTLQWTDSEETQNETPQSQPQSQPQQQPQTPPDTSQTMNNNYILAEEQLEKIYGANWRDSDKLDWVDEFDFLFNHRLTDTEQSLLKGGANLSIEIDGIDYTIPIQATTLACYHDYDDLSAQEIDEIMDALKLFVSITGIDDHEKQNATELLEQLKLFKKHNK